MVRYVKLTEKQVKLGDCWKMIIIGMKLWRKLYNVDYQNKTENLTQWFYLLEKRPKIAITVASSGIAATLLNGGRTAHSVLKLPLNLAQGEFSICNFSKNSSRGVAKGESVIIPPIPITPTDFPFPFKRVQFRVKLRFAVAINKAEGPILQVGFQRVRSRGSDRLSGRGTKSFIFYNNHSPGPHHALDYIPSPAPRSDGDFDPVVDSDRMIRSIDDPASAIPKGTLLSLLISMISYAMMVLFSGGAALRDASGNITDLMYNDGAYLYNESHYFSNGTLLNFGDFKSISANYSTLSAACADYANEQFNCTYGLHNNYAIMQLMSAWGPFIYGGCWAATLSTALTNLLSVPRLIQALGVDRIYPGLIFFSKPYGRHGEPYRGYVLTFLVSAVFLLIADLNKIAPLISNFYLASYALINFCTFHAALVRPLGWRPTFRFYNVWLSLAGFLMCVAIMLLISWVMSLVTFAIFFTLYLIVHYRKPDQDQNRMWDKIRIETVKGDRDRGRNQKRDCDGGEVAWGEGPE
ncbi:Bumetanide-sensitive sodium-(potassium)-chloride cotransporter [Eumeta japonica]|uniref:ATP-dependent DNA helicase n=1 Tax=Eumeta variegata TaxID=151549 RepID=A0A4C1T0G5_EUMVA|nr:Bumetanide-sensitive sodium-(potassium)-chloride cotransporter [Eumeta japonica]